MKTLFTLALAVTLAEAGLAVVAPDKSGLIEGIRTETRFLMKEQADRIVPLAGTADELPEGVTARR